MAKNMVIAGDYMGKPVGNLGGQPQIMVSSRWSENAFLDKAAIDSYEVITEETSKAPPTIPRATPEAALLLVSSVMTS